METEIHRNFIYALFIVLCFCYTLDALHCPLWYRYRVCYNRPCTVVRNGFGRPRYDCLSWEEYRLLQRALNGGATGPGTGIGESLVDQSEVLQLHININNTNDNQINQEGSNNVDVSQVQAQLSPDQCISCPAGVCPRNQYCVATQTCPGIRMSCRSIIGR